MDSQEKRVVQLIEKGVSMFEDSCKGFKNKIEKTWTEIEDYILSLKESAKNIKTLRKSEQNIKENFELYLEQTNGFELFLKKSRIELEKERLMLETKEKHESVETFMKRKEIELNLRALKREEAIFDGIKFDQLSLPEYKVENRAQPYINNLPDLQPDVHVQPANFIISDIATILLRKQLIPERLSSFDDKPESYNAWKCSFKSITAELKVSESEELDLLVNKLSARSKEVAKSVRNAHPSDVSSALKLIWDRLDEMYGRTEIIAATLKAELEHFRYVTVSDVARLYDLLNILIKVESIKSNPEYSATLAYYDSAVGVNPILAKLAHDIQDKWISRAAMYKKYHSFQFPPFSFFVTFVREMRSIKNDPAFAIKRPLTHTKNDKHFVSRCIAGNLTFL